MATSPSSIADIRPAKYNPRQITDKQISQLDDSIHNIAGDLSGIVVNVAGKYPVTVSGHQRLKTLKGKKTRIVKTEQKKDSYGTIATGFIEVIGKNKSIIKIPYREVHWPSKTLEMVANINANSAGGEFDQAKLGAVLEEIEKDKKFDVESVAMDGFDFQKALIQHQRTLRTQKPSTNSSQKEADAEEFTKVDPEAEEFEVVCPRCKLHFNPS